MVEPMAPVAPRRQIEVVDYLRLLAAVSVLGFHYLYNGIDNGKVSSITHGPLAGIASYGYFGVHLFFLISGYLIAASAAGKSARQFAVGRALRLYPAFWVAVFITAGFTLVLGGETFRVTADQVLWNLTMIPEVFDVPLVDGVYWTLLYELKFYALIFLVILCGLGHRLTVLMPAWGIVQLALVLFAHDLAEALPFIGGYYFYFAAGAVMSVIGRHGWTPYRAIGLVATYLGIVRFDLSETDLIRTAIFLAILATTIPAVQRLRLPGSKSAGALTYPLYLLHAHIGYMLLDTFATEQNKVVVYVLVIGFVFALSYTLHVVVERRPASRVFWKRFMEATIGRFTSLLQSVVDEIRDLPSSNESAGEGSSSRLHSAPRP